MTKELEALLELKEQHYRGYLNDEEYIEKVNEVLNNYVSDYNNTKPSEAMKCSLKLYKMVESAGNGNGFNLNEAWKYHNTIKQALLKLDFLEDAIDLPTNCFSSFENRNGDEVTVMRRERYEEYQEQEKVLEIIKEKGVDIGYFKTCKTLEEYNENCWNDDEDYNKKLTEKEFDTLKRYF